MDTYAPRTLEQFHACQRQRQISSALVKGGAPPPAAAASHAPAAAAKSAAKGSSSAARADGRANAQLRSTFLQVGVVSAAVGSAYVERQGTKILCAVYGPRASSRQLFSERGQFVVDVKFAPFAGATRRVRRGAQADADERRLVQQLTEALTVSIHLEAFPKAVLEAFVLVLQDDGSVFTSAVSCISLALSDAGIMLYDLVTACQAVSLDGSLLLDPSGAEEAAWTRASTEAAPDVEGTAAGTAVAAAAAPAPVASVVLAYMPSLRQISSITQAGSSTTQQVTELTHLCISGCEQLSGLMRECLLEAAKRQIGNGGANVGGQA